MRLTIQERYVAGEGNNDESMHCTVTVTIPAGKLRVPFDIPLNIDRIVKGSRNFIFTIDLSTLPKVVTIDPGQARVVIKDNDGKLM